jgi:hypothetical protein
MDMFAFAPIAFGVPNHIHPIWRTNKLNGKETVQGSFLKYTAHQYKKMQLQDLPALSKYAVDAPNKKYEFWQRDSLAIDLYTREVMLQKLRYIHMNPLAPHWQVAADPNNYFWSSVKFYEMAVKNFGVSKNIWDEFG